MECRVNAAHLRRVFGLDVGEWSEVLAYQAHRCAICERSFTRSRPACVDHRHASGRVRGALCSFCNEALGVYHDNAEWFRRAAEYLTDPPAPHAIGNHYVPHSPGAAGIRFEEEQL